MRPFGLVLITALVTLTESRACSVPVFRYALENWTPSNYELLYATDDGRDLPAAVNDLARRANVRIRAINAATETDPMTLELIRGPRPVMLLRYPDSTAEIPPAWSTTTDFDPAPVFDSPARRQLVRYLKQGYAGVVVLLHTGDAEKDRAARAFLDEHVPRIAGRIELPPPTPDGPQVRWAAPVRVEFPIVELRRTDAEDVFVRVLLGMEDGLKDVTGPVAFPVFGRGRALCALHGRDLEKPSELQRSLEYLCRACSCQVKELNPGLDLLLATDWEAPAEPEDTSARPGNPDPPGEAPARPEPDEPTSAPTAWRPSGALVVAAVAAVVVTGLWVLRSRRRPG